jgi:hypothetical protein
MATELGGAQVRCRNTLTPVAKVIAYATGFFPCVDSHGTGGAWQAAASVIGVLGGAPLSVTPVGTQDAPTVAPPALVQAPAPTYGAPAPVALALALALKPAHFWHIAVASRQPAL